MQYSEKPHVEYLDAEGRGPGSNYVGDLERWNWRWLIVGDKVDHAFDIALWQHFNQAQRDLMQRPPLEAMSEIEECAPAYATPEAWERAREAQVRLFPPKVAKVEDNVIHANFGSSRS